ncbi:hypothetical protein JR316_0009166 [Psilocybe cubensis]|uniref:Uncharacterized protein n=2 Tax=Psilocybe cubensis TaxID=181762 RepID=A0ACB8GU12_PSICU|nr:hypothetical protein JR316_0009166 [Psilocybe cubensis]KAH9478706.1 hypothetical protein JR316_0009166 [Psilocybe cubensis]
MSTTAKGRITGGNGERFTAMFILPGSDRAATFLGNFYSSVPSLTCDDATLTYNNPRDLTAARQFEAQLGVNNVKFTMNNGVIIEGVLNTPISPPISASGAGVWVIE